MQTCTFPSGATTTCQLGFASSSAANLAASAFTDTGTMLSVILIAVVGGTIALMGLGFGIRHVSRWITGRKF